MGLLCEPTNMRLLLILAFFASLLALSVGNPVPQRRPNRPVVALADLEADLELLLPDLDADLLLPDPMATPLLLEGDLTTMENSTPGQLYGKPGSWTAGITFTLTKPTTRNI